MCKQLEGAVLHAATPSVVTGTVCLVVHAECPAGSHWSTVDGVHNCTSCGDDEVSTANSAECVACDKDRHLTGNAARTGCVCMANQLRVAGNDSACCKSNAARAQDERSSKSRTSSVACTGWALWWRTAAHSSASVTS
jgi:hypothetical protein